MEKENIEIKRSFFTKFVKNQIHIQAKGVSPIEFNWRKMSIMRYVFSEIFGLFW